MHLEGFCKSRKDEGPILTKNKIYPTKSPAFLFPVWKFWLKISAELLLIYTNTFIFLALNIAALH